MQLPSNKRVGFTLIELLVVIAIIAILSVIVFPVFARARAQADQDTCLSNIKQLAAACQMYAAEWDDYLPMQELSWTDDRDPDDPATLENKLWGQMIYPYVKNLQLFMCPKAWHTTYEVLDDLTDVCWPEEYPNHDYYCFFMRYGISYGYNYLMGFTNLPCCGERRVLQHKVVAPVNTVMLADAAPGQGIPGEEVGSAPYLGDTYWVCGYAMASMMASVHNEGANLGFVDGHAKWLAYPANRRDVVWYPDRDTPGGLLSPVTCQP